MRTPSCLHNLSNTQATEDNHKHAHRRRSSSVLVSSSYPYQPLRAGGPLSLSGTVCLSTEPNPAPRRPRSSKKDYRPSSSKYWQRTTDLLLSEPVFFSHRGTSLSVLHRQDIINDHLISIVLLRRHIDRSFQLKVHGHSSK